MEAEMIDKYAGNTAGFIKDKIKFRKRIKGNLSFTIPDEAKLVKLDGKLWWDCNLLVPFYRRK